MDEEKAKTKGRGCLVAIALVILAIVIVNLNPDQREARQRQRERDKEYGQALELARADDFEGAADVLGYPSRDEEPAYSLKQFCTAVQYYEEGKYADAYREFKYARTSLLPEDLLDGGIVNLLKSC